MSRYKRVHASVVPVMSEHTVRSIYKPYATEMGHANIAWNRLQQNLANLFGIILGPKKAIAAAAIWYSYTNDRNAREMLVELAAATIKRTEILDDIKWLLDEAKGLSSDRNAAIHAPLKIIKTGPETHEVVPDYFEGGNKLAARLKGKDLIAEYNLYAQKATQLSEYAWALTQHIYRPSLYPWLHRPGLPLFVPRESQEEQRRKKDDKRRRHRQQSARASSGKPRKKN